MRGSAADAPECAVQLMTIGSLNEIPVGEGRAYAVDGEQVAVFHLRDGTVRALQAICPHRGGPLADGLIDGAVVVCPLHGYSYDLVTGEETANGGVAVRPYAVLLGPDGTVQIGPCQA